MHYKNGNSNSSRSNIYTPTRHILTPINPGLPLTLNLDRHPWHITGPAVVDGPRSFIAAFSNFDCAVMTADHYIAYGLDHSMLSPLERLFFVQAMRIEHPASDMKWAKTGNEWIPVKEGVN